MPKSPAKRASEYDVHPGVAMVQNWIADLPAKTGRSLDDWLARIEKDAPRDAKGRVAWLKAEGLGTNTASWLANRSLGSQEGFADDDPDSYLAQAPKLVDAMYAGKKAHLRPIYDALLAHARETFPDLRVCPCQTMVPFYRTFVFAQVKPTTNSRVDLGLALAKHKGALPDMLIDTGGLAKKDRITHRIPLESPSDITPQVLKWLRRAYDLDAPKPAP